MGGRINSLEFGSGRINLKLEIGSSRVHYCREVRNRTIIVLVGMCL